MSSKTARTTQKDTVCKIKRMRGKKEEREGRKADYSTSLRESWPGEPESGRACLPCLSSTVELTLVVGSAGEPASGWCG